MKQPRHDMQTPTQSKAMPRTAPEKECLKREQLYLISLKNPGSFPAFKWHQEEPGTSLHPRQSREELADQREAGIWNTLPTSVMEVRSFEEFRRKLDTFPNKGRLKNGVSDNARQGGKGRGLAQSPLCLGSRKAWSREFGSCLKLVKDVRWRAGRWNFNALMKKVFRKKRKTNHNTKRSQIHDYSPWVPRPGSTHHWYCRAALPALAQPTLDLPVRRELARKGLLFKSNRGQEWLKFGKAACAAQTTVGSRGPLWLPMPAHVVRSMSRPHPHTNQNPLWSYPAAVPVSRPWPGGSEVLWELGADHQVHP